MKPMVAVKGKGKLSLVFQRLHPERYREFS